MYRYGLMAVLLCVTAASFALAEVGDSSRVVFDFETGDLQGWRVVDGAFGKLVCEPRDVRNHQGKLLLTTLQREDERRKSDVMTGAIESPVFVLRAPQMSLRVGGGKHASTYVALCTLDGKQHLKARGKASVVMQEHTWNAPKLVGKKVFLRIVDQHERGWGHVTFDDFEAVGQIDAKATAERFAAIEEARREAEVRRLRDRIDGSVTSLRLAVSDLMATFADRYPRGPQFLAKLDAFGRRAGGAAALDELSTLHSELLALERETLLANPLLIDNPILFVVRHQYRRDHHNTATMFQTDEINTGSFEGGGAIKTIDVATGQVKTLLEVPDGVARDPDVSFDGTKVLFSMRHDRDDDYHLYEINADGSGSKQLTIGSGLSDIDPIYLPNDRILFTSTREPKYCMCNRHIMGNLFTMDADGANIQQIGHSTLHEGHASLLPDGRVIYDRWEYVDRNFGDAQGVWVANPDGTNHAIYWGNNTNSPGAVLDARAIPGTELFIANFSSCHDRPWGALAIIDRRLGMDGREPVLRTWPASAVELIGQGNYDTFVRVHPKYEDPYPLSDKHFLCSRMTGNAEQMGLFLIDTFGNEVLVHSEGPGCYDPMPLASRTRPLAIPSRIDLAESEGRFYVENVYEGTGMERVEPGSVKFLRVVESPEKRFWTRPAWNGGTGAQAPGMGWDDFNNKRILGTVPVQADGSVFFTVPADTFVYFQLLDEKGMMIQSMRSGTIVRPGEMAGCVGCHENRRSTALLEYSGTAWQRGPRELEPWYGSARLFSYTAEVQPVFDRHCVDCHDYGEEAGQKLNLAADRNLVFNTSYVELRRKGYVQVVGAGPFLTQMPKSWGSHASPLAKVLVQGHEQTEIDKEIQLDPESVDRIITWIDINAPYYGHYASAYGDNPYGRSALTSEQLKRLSDLTGINLTDRRHIDQVNLTRPEYSPCLAKLSDQNDSTYQEALAIIHSGKQQLAARPRADMPEFQLVSPGEIRQQKKYDALLEQETRMRTAIVRGEKQFTQEEGENH